MLLTMSSQDKASPRTFKLCVDLNLNVYCYSGQSTQCWFEAFIDTYLQFTTAGRVCDHELHTYSHPPQATSDCRYEAMVRLGEP